MKIIIFIQIYLMNITLISRYSASRTALTGTRRHAVLLQLFWQSALYCPDALPYSGHCIAACRNIYLGNLPDGSRVLANVAGIMAACYGRPRQIHQIRQCSSDNGYRRRSRYPDCFRIFARRFGGTRGLLVSLALFSVYPVLWCSRL